MLCWTGREAIDTLLEGCAKRGAHLRAFALHGAVYVCVAKTTQTYHLRLTRVSGLRHVIVAIIEGESEWLARLGTVPVPELVWTCAEACGHPVIVNNRVCRDVAWVGERVLAAVLVGDEDGPLRAPQPRAYDVGVAAAQMGICAHMPHARRAVAPLPVSGPSPAELDVLAGRELTSGEHALASDAWALRWADWACGAGLCSEKLIRPDGSVRMSFTARPRE